MKQSSYRHYDLRQSKRQTLTVSRFGGVDLTSQKFMVDSSRAIDASNFIYKNHTVQKRNGYEELFKVSPVSYYIKGQEASGVKTNGTNFNGMWYFTAEDNQKHLVAHIGNLLFEIKNFNGSIGVDTTIEPIRVGLNNNVPVCYQFEDYKSSAYVGNKMLWFFGGNRYMVIRYPANSGGNVVITPVDEWEYTYVPTTTISITAKNTSGANRASLDNVNLLTKWRRNKCITGYEKAESDGVNGYTYELDSPILFKNPTEPTELSGMSGTLIERSE